MDITYRPLIMVVDDSVMIVQYLCGILEEIGYRAISTVSGVQAFELAKSTIPDLILLDVIMPNIDGFAVCEKIKKEEQTKDIPIIFITGRSNSNDVVKGFEIGGVDYIAKPFNAQELISRVKTHVELKISRDKLRNYAIEVERTNIAMKKTLKELDRTNLVMKKTMENLDRASKTDFLTGLFNRKYIIDRLKMEKIRHKKERIPFCILLADIDLFKRFNDTYGHECGDYVLKQLSEIFVSSLTEIDVVARWGGEEFLFFMPEKPIESAINIAQKIKDKIKETQMEYMGEILEITLTMGATDYGGSEDIDTMIRRADNGLYEGKMNGRNRVVCKKSIEE